MTLNCLGPSERDTINLVRAETLSVPLIALSVHQIALLGAVTTY